MSKLGRNDSCPCGSGKKYKKCCLTKDEQRASRRLEQEQAVQIALAWLWDTFPEETDESLRQGFFGGLTAEQFASFEELEPWLNGLLNMNSLEWLLAEGILIVDGAPKPVIELLLGSGGPLLPAHGREWLKAMAASPLRLYEVQEAKPGEGLRVLDLLDPSSEPVWVREHAASNTLVRWDILGARLIEQGDSSVFSGAIYPFDREEGVACREMAAAAIASSQPTEKERRTRAGSAVIDAWLKGLVAEPDEPPELVDAESGDQILF